MLNTTDCFLECYDFSEKKELIDNTIVEISMLLDHQPSIIFFGKECFERRDVGFFSNESRGYQYSGKFASSKPLTENLEVLLNEINRKFNSNFNGILINRYNNGDNYIGKHSDDESALDKIGVISLSWGAERIFRIRNKKSKEIVMDIKTKPYQIIHMGGSKFQSTYTHEVPKTKKVKDVRYNFTFRKHLI